MVGLTTGMREAYCCKCEGWPRVNPEAADKSITDGDGDSLSPAHLTDKLIAVEGNGVAEPKLRG